MQDYSDEVAQKPKKTKTKANDITIQRMIGGLNVLLVLSFIPIYGSAYAFGGVIMGIVARYRASDEDTREAVNIRLTWLVILLVAQGLLSSYLRG